jgi:choline dehydrogenase-like flavoprotein
MATQEKVDVAIVGAGPAGSVFADMLTRAGKKVVVLEFGPDWQNEQLISSEIWGRRIKHAPRFQLAGRNNPGHGSNAGWGTGGSMLHWFANFPRLHPIDFKVKTSTARGLDWPISYDDLSPYYDRIAADIGVSGNAAAERRWFPIANDYPMPPLKSFRHGDIFVDAFRKPVFGGADADRHQLDRGKGRPACIYDGWCHVGCPIGAPRDPQFTHLRTRAARRRAAPSAT